MAAKGVAALEGDTLDIVPNEDTVSTLSFAATDYKLERDTTICFLSS